MDKDFIHRTQDGASYFLILSSRVSLNLHLVLEINIFLVTIRQFLLLMVSSHHPLSTLSWDYLGYLLGLVNSQALPWTQLQWMITLLWKIFYLRFQTHHTTSQAFLIFLHLDHVNSFGLVAGIGAKFYLIGSDPAELTKSKTLGQLLRVCFQVSLTMGASFMVGIPVPFYVIPFFVDPFGEYGDKSSSFVPQTDASRPVPDGLLASMLYWNRRSESLSWAYLFCRRCALSTICPHGKS